MYTVHDTNSESDSRSAVLGLISLTVLSMILVYHFSNDFLVWFFFYVIWLFALVIVYNIIDDLIVVFYETIELIQAVIGIVWLPENEFHWTYDMCPKFYRDSEWYQENLLKRRELAHKSDLEEWDSVTRRNIVMDYYISLIIK